MLSFVVFFSCCLGLSVAACGENEVPDDCPINCNTVQCPLSADEKQVCTQADRCVPGCICRFNYRRALNGSCISIYDCPPFDCSAKRNEEYVVCPAPFLTYESCKPRPLPYKVGLVFKCIPKCQCKDGYGRVNGTCVPIEEYRKNCQVLD